MSFVRSLIRPVSGRAIQAMAYSSKSALTDEEIIQKMIKKEIKFHQLESITEPDYERAVRIRRAFVKGYIKKYDDPTKADLFEGGLPYENYDYNQVHGANCENVVGYIPIPAGIAGPIVVDGKAYPIPMATTEGALVASTHRGARALGLCGGVTTILLNDGMTRGPVVIMPSLKRAAELKDYVENTHYDKVCAAFASTTRFGRVQSVKVSIVGRNVYMRFQCKTGDAMGMNMVTKGVTHVLDVIAEDFPDMVIGAVSGNFCIDKKPSALNWVQGRGKSIVAEAVVKKDVIEKVLKSNAAAMAKLNVDKNLIGSAMAGSIGGFNAHASNVVAAIFIATGQDPAQVVASSNCITHMEDHGGDLYVSCAMPTIEVGTIGGGTKLPAQHSMLQLLEVDGPNAENPGQNATNLAKMICASVMASELSLMAGLAAGHLIKAHMDLNRK